MKLGGFPSTSDALASLVHPSSSSSTADPIEHPSLDCMLHVLRDSKRRRSIGPDAIPIELVQIGGHPAASLLHGLVVASWFQKKAQSVGKEGECATSRRETLPFLSALINAES